MEIPAELLKDLKFTDEDVARGTVMIQGAPRYGKTALAQRMAEAIVGPDNTFIIDWPEEEGTGTLGDRHVPYRTMLNQADLDLWYPRLVKMKPRAIIWDGLASSYWLLMKERVPSGIPPEDHGKTWMAVATALRREIVRFKLIESVDLFIITSLVWPDKDELTGREGRLQVTIPGQLKSNIYGLFSYNLLIELEDQANGESLRVLRTKPTSRYVAGVRAPIDNPIPTKIVYDLKRPGDAEMIATKLGRKVWTPDEGRTDDDISGGDSIRTWEGEGGPTGGTREARLPQAVGADVTTGEGGSATSGIERPVRKLPLPRARS